MATLGTQLDLDRCPHCQVDRPTLTRQFELMTSAYTGVNQRQWRVYLCARCGGLVTASASRFDQPLSECFPSAAGADPALPEKAREYLKQALNSLHAPAGAILLAASSVDAMLKEKKYIDGSLNTRIDKAAKEHVITDAMAEWAHKIRLDANDQRHADQKAPLPTEEEARQCLDFAVALGQFMFVLPTRVQTGLAKAQEPPKR